MAKATLQRVRAQYGDNSPATVVAFQAALETHQRYIKVLAALLPLRSCTPLQGLLQHLCKWCAADIPLRQGCQCLPHRHLITWCAAYVASADNLAIAGCQLHTICTSVAVRIPVSATGICRAVVQPDRLLTCCSALG